jgi:glutathione S-transferase
VGVNPNSKIPALVDRSGQTPIRVFESGAILIHLAEKFGAFLPTEPAARAKCLSWLMWQMGSAPYLGGGFGHFYAYAPTKIEYAIDRFAMEVKRQMDVLDRRLAENEYLGGTQYTIADMAVWPWYGALAKGLVYQAGEFLQVAEYKNVQRWTDAIAKRPAVQRGRMVNRINGDTASQQRERHEASRRPAAAPASKARLPSYGLLSSRMIKLPRSVCSRAALSNLSLTGRLNVVLHAGLGDIMKFYSRLIARFGMLVAVPAFAGIPDSPQQVQPLSTSTPRRRTRSPRRGEGCNKVTMSRVLMYELFVFQTLVDREAPNVEQEPVTMIQHDQQSRWKAWMRMLAVDIRPISMSMLKKSTSFSTGVTRPGVLSVAMRPSLRRPELRLTLIPPAHGTRQ